jgi:hypothetical protein
MTACKGTHWYQWYRFFGSVGGGGADNLTFTGFKQAKRFLASPDFTQFFQVINIRCFKLILMLWVLNK